MMKHALRLAFAALLSFGASAAHAVVNADVNIAYPIAYSANDNYVKFAFSTTCPGGQNTVKWAIDGNGIGYGEFYDNFNAQFLQKAGTGWHTFEVYSSCGQDIVKFYVN